MSPSHSIDIPGAGWDLVPQMILLSQAGIHPLINKTRRFRASVRYRSIGSFVICPRKFEEIINDRYDPGSNYFLGRDHNAKKITNDELRIEESQGCNS
jgi:hypothetical protein